MITERQLPNGSWVPTVWGGEKSLEILFKDKGVYGTCTRHESSLSIGRMIKTFLTVITDFLDRPVLPFQFFFNNFLGQMAHSKCKFYYLITNRKKKLYPY